MNVPAARQPALSPRERVDAALARGERARAPRLELTAAPDGVVPAALRNVTLAQATPKKGVIVIPSCPVSGRSLFASDVELRAFESARLARLLLQECFGDATGPEVVVSVLELAGAKPTIESADAGASPHAACVRKQLVERVGAADRQTRLRIAVRFVPRGEPGLSDVQRLPPTSSSVDEEIVELARMLGDPANDARKQEFLLLLGARRLDAARLAAAAPKREEHLAAARFAFEQTLVAQAAGAPARAAALRGLSTTLTMQGKIDEATRAARTLVCPSRYPSPTSPIALDQDHPKPWWERWENVHRVPTAATKPADRKMPREVLSAGWVGPRAWDEETKYRSPYDGCAAPADTPASFVADAWRDIAAYHAEADPAAGPFADNRAATALRLGLAASAAESGPFAALELGRILIRQQRYAEAARVVGRVAAVTDVDRDRDPDLTERAAQLVATALTHLDLEGGAEAEPLIERPDVLDEPDASAAEKKLNVVLDRIDRAELVPQNETFTPLVVRWLAWELEAMDMRRLAVAVQEKFLARFPKHRDAPLVRRAHLETLTTLSRVFRPGTPEASEWTKRAAEARARFVP